MTALAKVELQLVMHFLDRRELLLFARSSRWLYDAADSAFAWKHAPPPQLIFSADYLSLPQRLSQSLWRHVLSTSIDWRPPRYPAPDRPSCNELAALISLPRISTLVIQVELGMEQWQQLGQSSALDSLTSLQLTGAQAPVGFLRHLTRLPRLSSLSLGCGCIDQEDSLVELSQLQSLTRLDVIISNNAACDSIALCPSLRHLTLS